MTGRLCKPDADFKRLWRTLMPGTPFPGCGVPEQRLDAERLDAASDRAESGTASRDDVDADLNADSGVDLNAR
jgi:hypothetical protein